jgi:hypothetical protein
MDEGVDARIARLDAREEGVEGLKPAKDRAGKCAARSVALV